MSTLILLGAALWSIAGCVADPLEAVDTLFHGRHTNNWAVLVQTSRFWFNYRHPANVFALYRAIKRMGIPDSNIIVLMADDVSCNPRNVFAGTVFHSEQRLVNVYGEDVEVDYRGYDVTVESVIRVLTGRHDDAVPNNKRLLSDENSNILVYMTGHGGDEFLKLQDAEEISSQDLADAFHQMYEKKRYKEILFMADTCQASTLHKRFYSPGIIAVGSSALGENSYSHHADRVTGVSVVDRFTYYLLEYIEEEFRKHGQVNGSLKDLAAVFRPALLHSNPQWRTDLFERDMKDVPITDFFGAKFALDTTVDDVDLLDPAPASVNTEQPAPRAVAGQRISFVADKQHNDPTTAAIGFIGIACTTLLINTII